MRIDIAAATSTGLLGRAPGLIPQWRVGAILAATAIRDPANDQLWLKFGQTQYLARRASGEPSGPAAGESLGFRVLRNSPVIALETLSEGARDQTDAAGDALRRVLPRQTSPASLLANTSWLLAQSTRAQSVPASVAVALQKLWHGLPSSEQLATEDGLKSALQRSGIFLESGLARSSPAETLESLSRSDMKSLLMAVKNTVAEQGGRPTGLSETPSTHTSPLPMLRGSLLPLAEAAPTLQSTAASAAKLDTLAQQVDGALSRLTATQLLNAAAQGLACLIELPVRHGNDASLLRFRFEKEPGSAVELQPGWTVEIALTLRQGAALHARVGFRSGRISVLLRSDSASVVTQLRTVLSGLAVSLGKAGLNVDQLLCLHGLPTDEPGQKRAQLVDIHA